MAFDSGDRISKGLINLFGFCLEAVGQLILRTAEIYYRLEVDQHEGLDKAMISKEVDEPSIGRFETLLRGVPIQNSTSFCSR